jgi:hypothetical protein
MTAELPAVRKTGNKFSVEVAPGASITWHTKLQREGAVMIIEINAPSLTKWTIDEARDRLEFPIAVLQ